MKRRSNFKTVYLSILAALAVICVLCIIHVHSILVDYENSQPENVALARVQALGDRPLSELMDTSSLTAEETAHLETLARGSDLSCKLKKTTDGGATLVYTVMSGDERICDGFYYASAFKLLRGYLKDPWQLDVPPESVKEDIR